MTEHEKMIEDCENRDSQLSDWEREFIDSIKKRMADGHSLTQKQADRLDEVWKKATSKG